MTNEFPFKRLVIKLPQRATDLAALEAAAGFAELLKLNLTATFVEDAELRGLPSIPGLRELRTLGAGWHPISAVEWHKELDNAASAARKLFDAVVRNRPIDASFCAIQGTTLALISEVKPEDIVVVIQPGNPAECMAQQFVDLIEAAFQTQAAVMMVPVTAVRTAGPVVAIVASANDPSIRTAIGIASAAGESLILVPTFDVESIRSSIESIGRRAGVQIEFGAPIDPTAETSAALSPLLRYDERIVVMTRRLGGPVLPSIIMAVQRVPVLIIGRDVSSSS